MNTNIVDFGAKGDGKTCNTQAIQKAIDSCCQSGGGIVTVPAGKYITGTIRLGDNMDLHLEKGAVLKATEDLSEYNELGEYPQNFGAPSEQWSYQHLIIAVEKKNVSISGQGTIKGCGDEFYGGELHKISNYVWQYGYYTIAEGAPDRPGQMICFIECERVSVTGITITNSSSWNLFLHGCEYVTLRELSIFNDKCRANSDGIDIDCCRYVTVSDCIINTGDDCIAIRGASDRLKNKKNCEYVAISNCVLSNSTCAIRIGVGVGEIHYVDISNIVIAKSGEGITFMTGFCGRSSTFITDVNISNIVGDDVGIPIQIFAGENRIERVTISDFKTNCKNRVIISANQDWIEDLVLRNIDIRGKEHEITMPETAKKERGDEFVYIGGVKRLVLDNIRIFASDNIFSGRNNVVTLKDCTALKKDIKLIYDGGEKAVEV